MKIEKTKIEDVLLIHPDVFNDSRGYFFESFNMNKYDKINSDMKFVQDNVSKSEKNILRGLHYQVGNSAQGKLCSVLIGKVLDVAVDIRFGSPTFGEYVSVELSEENHNQLWIPPGFAHGFCVLSEEVIFSYKCTQLYNKNAERCIRFDDADLNINWKVNDPILSEKDKKGVNFKEIEEDFNYLKMREEK